MDNKPYVAEFFCAFLKLENNCKIGGMFGSEICSLASSTINRLVNRGDFLRKVIEFGGVRLWMGERGVGRHLSQVQRAMDAGDTLRGTNLYIVW